MKDVRPFLSAKLQPFVSFEHGLEVGPFDLVHFIEGIEVNGDDFRGVFREHGIYGRAQLSIIHRGGQVLNNALLVRDAQGVEKITKQVFVFFKQPGAKQIGRDGFQGGFGERGQDSGMLLGPGLTLKKNRAHFARVGHRAECGFVERFVVLVSVREDFGRQRRRHEAD